MDNNLEDSLNMESIENMDFDHSGVEVNQEDITLKDPSQASDMPMDLDTIEESPTLLHGGSDEVIVSDFIGEQFGFQEYSMQGDNSSGANITIEENQLGELAGQNEQAATSQNADTATKPTTSQPGVITIKAVVTQQKGSKKPSAPATYPRQVAIAPKPMKGAPNVQYAIAPKPVAIMMNKNTSNVSKTVPVKGVVQGLKGNTVLAQIGKQIVMVPAGSSGQKIKLSSIIPGGSTDSNIQLVRCSSESAQLISNKGGKPLRTKFIVQGQSTADPSNQPAVITKLRPVTVSSTAATRARYVMQQKTVPISIGANKVVVTSPTKQLKVAPKKHIISIKSQSPNVVTSQANVQTKKVVITANPSNSQNVIVKTAGTKAGAQTTKDITVNQRTQLHPINVPGKGIQFIKLVTNQSSTTQKSSKPQTLTMGKNFVLTDSKGNIIQMTAEKVVSSEPPPLLVTAASSSKVAAKGKKLVRIAPISQKSDTPSAQKATRASQSLLMPLEAKTVLTGTSVSLEEFNEMVDQNKLNNFGVMTGENTVDEPMEPMEEGNLVEGEQTDMQSQAEPIDVKPTLASLISDAVAGEAHEIANVHEVEIAYDSTARKQEHFTEDENTSSMEQDMSNERLEENVLIVPSNITSDNTREGDEAVYQDDTNTSMDDSHKMHTIVNVEADVDVMPYLSPRAEQNFDDSAYMFEGNSEAPRLRPRKACNCTRSQCLKLYCDCFANGEFCNKCNCNNCHNNLENEELRQKAIRACLDRNPNAFRPKIGKAKSGGPDIVRRHNKGCNCKRSGCLKNYCECYEAKIACTFMCKCVGCRNIEETLERRRDAIRIRDKLNDQSYRPPLPMGQMKQPCSFLTPEVIEAVAQCMVAAVAERPASLTDPVEDILLEFSRCMADIISASHQAL